MRLFIKLGTFVYVFCGMISFHQAYTTVKFPTARRVVKIGGMAIGFVWLLSMVFGMAAYFSLGDQLKSIELFPSRPALPNSDDIFNKILKSGKSLSLTLVLFFSLMVCYAVNLLPIKENLFQAFEVKNPTNKANMIMTLGIVLISTSCAWLYQEVTSWL